MSEQTIALFLPTLAGGGAERAIVNLAWGLSDRGQAVELVVGSDRGPLRDQLPQGLRVVNLNGGRLLGTLPKLYEYLVQRRPSFAIGASPHATVALVALTHLSRCGTNVVATVHTRPSEQAKSSWKSLLVHQLVKLAYPHADAIIAVSDGAADDTARFIDVDPNLVRRIYNPVITPTMHDAAREPLPHGSEITTGDRVVIAVGRLSPEKDFPTLIRAFARASQRINAKLVVLGDGGERRRLESLASDLGIGHRVWFAGFRRNPYPFMARADLLVLSSRWEGFGNVIIEALALGTPVVSTDCESGPAELLDRGRYGRLTPVGDDVAMAEAIVASLSDAEPRLPDPAFLEQFTVERVADQYLRVMQEVACR